MYVQEEREKNKKVRILKQFFQAYGKCRPGVDLQHGRGGRGQTQACKAFAGKRCTEQVWQPNHRLLQLVLSNPKKLNHMVGGTDL